MWEIMSGKSPIRDYPLKERRMTMFKKFIVMLLSILMVLSLTSCGVRQSLNEKIVEKVAEGVVDKATGGAADIDFDKDKITIKGKDGEEFSIGDTKWPKTGAAKLIPELKKGKIVSAINSDTACLIMIEQVEEKDFKQYVEELKDRGFTNDVVEHMSELGQSYNASLDENSSVGVLYEPESQGLSISFETNK